MDKQKHWWEQFCHDNASNLIIKNIITSINKLEKNLDKDGMIRVKNSINKLDPNIYSEEIKKLEKRYNILENRLERQISDDFGVLLKYLRKKKEFSLAKLGELTGISPSYINRLELNQRKSPSINIMESLANALDVPLSILAKAAGINFDGNEIYPIKDLIKLNMVSLEPYGDALTELEKEKLIDIINIITSNNYNDFSEVELIKEVKLFREIFESNNKDELKSI